MIRIAGALCAALLLGGCSLSGFESTGPQGSFSMGNDVDSGVGGTGFSSTPGEDGVGGTGISFDVAQPGFENNALRGDEGVGGTGIFGIISAFGSIIVNGVHIDYAPETPVSIDGEHATSADFAIGQLVLVEADQLPETFGERYQARLVEIQHAVVGPVSDVDVVARTFIILGQTVVVQDSDRLPETGDWIKVSGLRGADGRVVASRIDRTQPGDEALVRGVLRTNAEGALVLGGLRLSSARASGVALNAGDEVLVRGRFGGDVFNVRNLRKAPSVPFGGRMRALLIEGYVSAPGGGARHIAGHAWILPDGVVGKLPRGLSGDAKGLPLLMKGVWGDDAMTLEPSFRRPLPTLLEPLPQTLEGEERHPGEWPDLLRPEPDRTNGERTSIDPTRLPGPTLLRAELRTPEILGTPEMPEAFLNTSRSLTGEQLSMLLRLGGVDLGLGGVDLAGGRPFAFDPTVLRGRSGDHERSDALRNGILPGEFFDNAQLRARIRDTQFDPALVRSIFRANPRPERFGVPASTRSPQVHPRIRTNVPANRAPAAR